MNKKDGVFMYLIYPVPKNIQYKEGFYACKDNTYNKKVSFDDKMEDEEYKIIIDDDGISIICRDEKGLFRAETTLKQIIFQSKDSIRHVNIHDKPDFCNRGVMLDISRCKVPTLKTLTKIVDILADLKVNQLQLYIEGFSFAYESYPDVWKGITPITGDEIKMLDKYCKERFIELVPNQNSYGHMMPWLSRQEFRHMAMCPDGWQSSIFGFMKNGWSLDLDDDKALEFLNTLYDDLLKNFSSDKFNVCCDETLDIGQGKSKESCDKYGKGQVYFNGLMKIYETLKSRNLKMMFWGDIIRNHPEFDLQLPKDIIALNWGYRPTAVTEESCKCFEEANVPYYVCPGTSAWNSIWGMTDRMLGNIKTSSENGLKHGAIGLLNTDWGDLWHLNHLPVSYAGYCYGAAMAWNVCDEEESLLCDYLNKFIFKDSAGVMGKLMLDMGLYYKKEMVDCMTKYGRTHLAHILCGGLEEKGTVGNVTKENLHDVSEYINEILVRLETADMHCDDKELIIEEIKAGGLLLNYICLLGLYNIEEYEGKSKEAHLALLKEMQDEVKDRHKRVWLARNKSSRMHEGLTAMTKI